MDDELQEDVPDRQDEMTTLSFELEYDIHLGTEPGEEKGNAILDMLRLQFVDIVKQLDALAFSCEPEEREAASRQVRAWLTSLNSFPWVPLRFRLRSLQRIEGYLDVLSRDMAGLIMRAYKIGVMHVRSEAKRDPELYVEMIKVISTAMDLAIRQLMEHAYRHYSPDAIEVRQSLNMAELGLAVARAAPRQYREDVQRLKQYVAEHELLRRMDMHSRTDEEKKAVFSRLRDYAMFVDSVFVRCGRKMPRKKASLFLIASVARPHLKARRVSTLPAVAREDCIVLAVSALARQALDDLQQVKAIEMDAAANGVLHLEQDVWATKVACKTLVRGLRIDRREDRRSVSKEHASIGMQVGIALPDDLMPPGQQEKKRETWSLYNISDHGVMLQCPVSNGEHVPVRSVLSFFWPGGMEDWPRYGLVRWVQVNAQGYQRMGVEFLPRHVRPARLNFVNIRSALVHDRCWPALMQKTKHGWRVWMGTREQHRSPLTVSIGSMSGDADICRIMPLGNYGYNYSLFRISEVLSMEEIRAMALMQGKDRKKSLDELDF